MWEKTLRIVGRSKKTGRDLKNRGVKKKEGVWEAVRMAGERSWEERKKKT